MKLLKKLGIGIIALVALAAIVGFFMPSKYELERSLTMKAAPANIYEQIVTMKNWEKWSPWLKMDPTMKLTYNDIPSGKGASYSWNAEKMGEGSLTIQDCNPDTFALIQLVFKGSGEGMSSFSIHPDADGQSTVTWKMWSDIGMNPFKRLMNQLKKGMMLKSFDDGLASIRDLAEKMPAPAPGLSAEVKDVPAAQYMYVHDSADVQSIGQHLGMDYGKIGMAMKKQGLQMAGPVFAIYYTDSQTGWAFDACAYTDKPGKDAGEVKAAQRSAGKAVLVKFFGNYDKTAAAHEAAHKYIDANGLTITGAPWEEYITDPMMEKDTAKWQTDVYYPVK